MQVRLQDVQIRHPISHMSKVIYIHAPNVHQGGGAALLRPLLQAHEYGDTKIVAQLDFRMETSELGPNVLMVKRVIPDVFHRLKAEWWLSTQAGPTDITLCFGNLPPLFRVAGRVEVFLQNRYLIDAESLNSFTLKTRVRLWVERWWLFARIAHVDAFIVQTPTMQRLLIARTKGKVPVRVLPFVANPTNYVRRVHQRSAHENAPIGFVYVASGEPHKNHRALVTAWCLLAQEHLFPLLTLTLDSHVFPDLCNWIEQQAGQHSLKIINKGRLSAESIGDLYREADAMIYPSRFESFGLPLIEAVQAGLPVLAAELDFVRDVIDPDESFDPGSSQSIARAVKRFMHKEEQPLALKNAEEFIGDLLRSGT
jgi:glycosyltransferase involved in cell wall biosynthesis